MKSLASLLTSAEPWNCVFSSEEDCPEKLRTDVALLPRLRNSKDKKVRNPNTAPLETLSSSTGHLTLFNRHESS